MEEVTAGRDADLLLRVEGLNADGARGDGDGRAGPLPRLAVPSPRPVGRQPRLGPLRPLIKPPVPSAIDAAKTFEERHFLEGIADLPPALWDQTAPGARAGAGGRPAQTVSSSGSSAALTVAPASL